MKAAIGTKWNPAHAIERRDGVFSERNPQMSRFDLALQRALLRRPVNHPAPQKGSK